MSEEFTTIIGLEVHVQLSTRSKLFCGCVNLFNPDAPNSQTCPVCLGLPGSLPVVNRKALELSIKTGLALHCQISNFTKWDRKQYFYPDLPKGYQTSQYDLPIAGIGYFEIESDGDPRRIRITRAHLEEDAGKIIHDETTAGGPSRIDLNRCGTPLLEIVTEPDFRSPREAKRFLQDLRLSLRDLEVSDCNMQEGSLRCDANVNLQIPSQGSEVTTPIVEIKNLNSFRNVEAALIFEQQRQYEEWKRTGITDNTTAKSTRGWNAEKEITFEQRGKEEVADYRYFPDPDLVPVTFSEEQIEEIRKTLLSSPLERRTRYRDQFELSEYDAHVIVDLGISTCRYFENVARDVKDAKLAANWITQDVLRERNSLDVSIEDFPITSELLSALLSRIHNGELTTKSGREIFTEMLAKAANSESLSMETIDEIVQQKGLERVTDLNVFEKVIDQIISQNPEAVDSFREGKQAAVGPLMGQIMKQIKGADPSLVRQLLIAKIESLSSS